MSRMRRSSGFVLLMVLMVLLVAGTLLTIAARRSCKQSLLAGRAERELQVRWAVRSIQTSFVGCADQMLEEARAETGHPAVAIRASCQIGTMKFQVLVSDEQAKAEVNVLAAHKGLQGLAASLQNLQSDVSSPLESVPLQQAPADLQGAYVSLEQLLQVKHPSQIFDPSREHLPADRITCWSDGRVNFKRADSIVLHEVLDGVLTQTQVEELMRFRDDHPDCTLGEALQHLQLKLEEIKAARSVLTDVSACHSVWVVAQGSTRNWYHLYVSRAAVRPAQEMRWSFQW